MLDEIAYNHFTKTAQALYVIVRSFHLYSLDCNKLTAEQSYDYTLEKVRLYTRVPLGDIVSITKGMLCIPNRRDPMLTLRYSRCLYIITLGRGQSRPDSKRRFCGDLA